MECTICYETIDVDAQKELHCSHVFHASCIDTWCNTGADTCPCCRSPMSLPVHMSHAEHELQSILNNMEHIRKNIHIATRERQRVRVHMFQAMLEEKERAIEKIRHV